MEMKFLKVAAAQYPITYHLSFENWKVFVEKWVSEAANQKAELLVFPEYGSMDLVSLAPEKVQRNLREQVQWLSTILKDFLETWSALAQKHNVMICAPSIPVLENKKVVNRCFFFSKEGKSTYQDKQMMTRFEDEEWGVSSGEPCLTIIETSYAKIGICICFDGEFAEMAREFCQNGVELLLVPSCTESMRGLHRVHVGARARALENQCFAVVAQTIGDAEWSLAVDKNSGQAIVVGPPDLEFPEDGILAKGELNKPSWIYCDLDFSKVDFVRRNGAVFNFNSQVPKKFTCELFKT
jgi:predicted amidohydrolase